MEPIVNQILVFSTDVSDRQFVSRVGWLFDQHPEIMDWNIDFQDVDRVLRIEALDKLSERDVIDIMRTFGFNCEVLPD